MCKHLDKTVGIACIFFLLQVGHSAQAGIQSSATESRSIKSSNKLSSSNQELALAGDSPGDKLKRDAVVETTGSEALIEPKVGPKNPVLKLRITPPESRLSEGLFANPDLGVLGDPQVFKATAYALNGRTRSGVYVRRGVIAADPRVLPLGSVVQLRAGDYSGVYTVHDTGRLIKGKIIDLWVPTNREARIFGRRKIKLHVLRLGPGTRKIKQ